MSPQVWEFAYETKLTALHKHALQLNSAATLGDVTELTLDAMEFGLGVDLAYVAVVENGLLRVVGHRGSEKPLGDLRLDGRGVTVNAANTKTTRRIRDTSREPAYIDGKGFNRKGPPIMLSELAVPVVVDDETVALLDVESYRLDDFTADDERLLEVLASHVASAISRLKKEELLRASEMKYRWLFEKIPHAIYQSSPDGKLLSVNAAFAKLFGYDSENELGAVDVERDFYVNPDDRKNWTRALEAQGEIRDVELVLKRGSGEKIIVLDSAHTVRDEHGLIRYYEGTLTDITERKHMEDQIKRYSEHLEQLVEERTRRLRENEMELRSARDQLEHVLATNPAVLFYEKPLPDFSDTLPTFVSESARFVLGFEPKKFVGETGLGFWRSRIHPDDLARFWTELPCLWRDGQHTFEYRFLHADGTYRWITEQYRVIRDAEGRISNTVTVAIDVTDRKQLEEKLAKAERLAAIGETAAMVGHDLRNPLQGIAAATYLLRNQSLATGEKNELLQLIENNVEYSDGIIKDLLDYSRPLDLALTETTPSKIITDALLTTRVPDRIKVQNLSQEEPSISVDSDRIKRAFVNLIENAVDAMPDGGTITISTKESNGFLEIAVADTGPGLPEEILGNLWKPLQTTKAKGMGLGLSIVKRIVDAHHGEVSVKSSTGEGTTYTIRLPLKRNSDRH